VTYTYNTPGAAKERPVDYFKTMQPRDWMIAAIAFLAGAIIF
jgi:hypothetical protein